MQRITVVDTSCLILLTKIEQLSLLNQLFVGVTVTTIVSHEYAHPLPKWIKVADPISLDAKVLKAFLDPGEAMALAVESPDSLLIIDELKGRKVAKELGVKFTGTLGLIKLAYKKGLIKNMPAVIKNIKETDFRASDDLLNSMLN